jgi:hypothetical protein
MPPIITERHPATAATDNLVDAMSPFWRGADDRQIIARAVNGSQREYFSTRHESFST